ncbi:MAG: type II toxin-antitoxin system RelE/ParE family toxin [bacterium]|nr:type II toxin-antitoxin system RelE/ParE family toxin [bacterium]
MSYSLYFTDKALKQLKKMDKATAALIIGWLEKNVQGCDNPRLHGKPLTANRIGQWRYRIGDYRVITEIEDNRLVVIVITVGHRREIYNL